MKKLIGLLVIAAILLTTAGAFAGDGFIYVEKNEVIENNTQIVNINEGTIINQQPEISDEVFGLEANLGEVVNNFSNIHYNKGTVDNNNTDPADVAETGAVAVNDRGEAYTGTVINNNSSVGENKGVVENNSENGEVWKNSEQGVVETNLGYVYDNDGTVEVNYNDVEDSSGTVVENFGMVRLDENMPGEVETNNGIIELKAGGETQRWISILYEAYADAHQSGVEGTDYFVDRGDGKALEPASQDQAEVLPAYQGYRIGDVFKTLTSKLTKKGYVQKGWTDPTGETHGFGDEVELTFDLILNGDAFNLQFLPIWSKSEKKDSGKKITADDSSKEYKIVKGLDAECDLASGKTLDCTVDAPLEKFKGITIGTPEAKPEEMVPLKNKAYSVGKGAESGTTSVSFSNGFLATLDTPQKVDINFTDGKCSLVITVPENDKVALKSGEGSGIGLSLKTTKPDPSLSLSLKTTKPDPSLGTSEGVRLKNTKYRGADANGKTYYNIFTTDF